MQQVLDEAAVASARKHDELIQSYNALLAGGISGAMRKKQKARRQMEQQQQQQQTQLNEASAAVSSARDELEPAPLNGTEMFEFRYQPAACKTYQRMRHLLETRHKPLKRPRPAHNLDVIRGTAVFSSVESLQAGFRALQRKLTSLVSVRNDFMGVEPTAPPAGGPTSAPSFMNAAADRSGGTSGSVDMAQTEASNTSSDWRRNVEEDETDQSDELSVSLHPDNERLEFVDREDGVLRSSGYRAIKIDFVHDANERCGWKCGSFDSRLLAHHCSHFLLLVLC